MPVYLTEHGRSILVELRGIAILCMLIPADNRGFNERLEEQDRVRKSQMTEQFRASLKPGQEMPQVSFPWVSPTDQNRTYTEALEKFVTESAICRAVDLYRWYLRRTLGLALSRDSSLIHSWASTLGITNKKAVEIESAASLEGLRGKELRFRELVHQDMSVPPLGVIPALVEVRNCIVHQRGYDLDNKIREIVVSSPELGIIVDARTVRITPEVAQSAVERLYSDISIIDQVLGNVLGVPRRAEPMPELKRYYGTGE